MVEAPRRIEPYLGVRMSKRLLKNRTGIFQAILPKGINRNISNSRIAVGKGTFQGMNLPGIPDLPQGPYRPATDAGIIRQGEVSQKRQCIRPLFRNTIPVIAKVKKKCNICRIFWGPPKVSQITGSTIAIIPFQFREKGSHIGYRISPHCHEKS